MFENITPSLLNSFIYCKNNAFFNIYNVKNPDNEEKLLNFYDIYNTLFLKES